MPRSPINCGLCRESRLWASSVNFLVKGVRTVILTTWRAGLPALLALLSLRALAAPVDPATLARISDEGFNHGQVVETAEYLADRIGGRLTNSPAMRAAETWTMGRFTAWGLKNVHREGFEFGRGWWIESSQVRMTAPRALVLRAIPIAWTPPTTGTLSAEVIVAPIKKERDFADWKGKLAGKIVLVSWPEPPKDDTESPTKRLADPEIGKLDEFKIPHFEPDANKRVIEYFSFGEKLDAFLAQEGAVAWARMSRREGHIVHGEGYMFHTGGSPRLPAVEIAAEDYRKLTRLAKGGPVTLAIDNVVHYEDADSKAYNIVAEIPGRDPKAGFVMAGAHLDSWVAGDGAADNGAGSAVILEASRILASLGVQPRRTLRFVLWSGEEQGLWGSGAYLEQHLARRPVGNPELAAMGPYFAEETYPVQTLPEFDALAAYFNIDNGSGKIRGIYAEGNLAVVPTLKEWLAPFSSLGAGAVVSQPTGGTDHVFLSRLGLPAFQFVQDPLDYESRVHHSELDVFDHLRPQDLRQAAVIVAAMMLDAANADQPLPRRVLPTQPRVTDPFAYPDPSEK